MASTSSSSFVFTSTSVGSSNSNGPETHQPLAGSDPSGVISDNNSSSSATLSTPLLVGIIAAVTIFVAVLLVIRSRRRRYEPKLFSPSNSSAFHGVTSTTASDHPSNTLGASSSSTTVMTSPQPQMLQTFRLPQLTTKETAGDDIAIDIQEVPGHGLPPERTTQVSRTTSLVSGRSVFSASIVMRGGLRSSLTSLAAFMTSRTSRNSGADLGTTTDSSATTVSFTNTVPADANSANTIEQRQTGDAWRDLSETCWSIGPGSDSECENDQFAMPAASYVPAGGLVLNRNRLSTLSDDVGDIEEERSQKDLDVNSLDDFSRRRDRVMSSIDDLSPRRERGISMFEDSSPRRIRGLSALESRMKANSVAEIDTNKSGASYFSVDSDYYGETIKDCSFVLFDDSDSSDSGSDGSFREEEF